jgi:hypothetical protein
VPAVGPAIHVKWKFGGGLDDSYLDTATEATSLARLMVRQMVTKMRNGVAGLSGNQRDILAYYFVFGTGGQAAEFPIIYQTVQLMANGLLGAGLDIKVTNQSGAAGYVKSHHSSYGGMDKLRAKFGKPKAGWTAGQRVVGGERTLVHRGAIHVDTVRLDTGPELAAKTIIHEASHKFASTADFGERGYTHDADGTFRADGLTHAEALNNAESYARFIMMAFLFPN